jgi:hypothetical protein
VDVGQPFYALQPGGVDEPSGLPFVLRPFASYKIIHAFASAIDELLLFWGPAGSIYGIIWRHAPFRKSGKGYRKIGRRRWGRSVAGESPETISFCAVGHGRQNGFGMEDGLAGPYYTVFDLGRNCVRNKWET